jgi:peptidoglycan/LPS O-acetylase OafA/YrhL
MGMDRRIFILKLTTLLCGITFGLFLGLIIFGTIFRFLLDLLFNCGDSGPEWVTHVIILLTLVSIVISCWLFLKCNNSFLKRRGYN